MNGYPVPWFTCFLSVSDDILKGRDSKMEFTGITFAAKARIWIQAPKLFILEKIQVLILILNLFQRMAVQYIPFIRCCE